MEHTQSSDPRESARKNILLWLDGRAQTAPSDAINISEDDLDDIITEELEVTLMDGIDPDELFDTKKFSSLCRKWECQ